MAPFARLRLPHQLYHAGYHLPAGYADLLSQYYMNYTPDHPHTAAPLHTLPRAHTMVYFHHRYGLWIARPWACLYDVIVPASHAAVLRTSWRLPLRGYQVHSRSPVERLFAPSCCYLCGTRCATLLPTLCSTWFYHYVSHTLRDAVRTTTVGSILLTARPHLRLYLPNVTTRVTFLHCSTFTGRFCGDVLPAGGLGNITSLLTYHRGPTMTFALVTFDVAGWALP